jgi:hypothetical protein
MVSKNFTHTEKQQRLAQLAGGRRVLFMVPKASGPSGGVRIIIEHAEVLQKFGVNATIVCPFSRDKNDIFCNGATSVVNVGGKASHDVGVKTSQSRMI